MSGWWFQPPEKYLSDWITIPTTGENNKCSKPPTRCGVLIDFPVFVRSLRFVFFPKKHLQTIELGGVNCTLEPPSPHWKASGLPRVATLQWILQELHVFAINGLMFQEIIKKTCNLSDSWMVEKKHGKETWVFSYSAILRAKVHWQRSDLFQPFAKEVNMHMWNKLRLVFQCLHGFHLLVSLCFACWTMTVQTVSSGPEKLLA